LTYGKTSESVESSVLPLQKVYVIFVMELSRLFGIKCGRVPNIIAGYTEIIGEEEANFPLSCIEVLNGYFFQIDVFMKIDRIIAPEKNSQSLIVHAHIGYQCIGQIAQVQFPTFSDPGEAAVNPDAESGIVATEVIFLSHMWKIEVSNAVVTVETHQKFSITDGYLSAYCLSFSATVQRERITYRRGR
jgi:hypothetical protein